MNRIFVGIQAIWAFCSGIQVVLRGRDQLKSTARAAPLIVIEG